MYLRESKQRRADGSTVAYLQLAENVWDPEKRRSQTRILCNCGRADDPAVTERLRRLAQSILRRCSAEEIVGASGGDWRLVCAWPYGDVYVLEAMWQRLGIGQIIHAQADARRMGFDVERALFAMVANRTCAPCSKLYCWEQWLKEEVHITGTKELSLQHLYRAMDFLEANKESIEREIFHRVADLLNLDVEVLFYDTTSLHFEVDEEDHGAGDGDTVHGSKAAGRKTYKAPRKRGHSKNGRGDAPQIVIGMAVTREGFPVRHWVFPGNTVDVTTCRSRRWCSATASAGPATRCASTRRRRFARRRTASRSCARSRPNWSACATSPRKGIPSACVRCAPAPAMADTCWTPTPASCSIATRSEPQSDSTASSWSTATTTRSAPRTWRWATSSCSASSRPGAT
jgi:hypothetical protein